MPRHPPRAFRRYAGYRGNRAGTASGRHRGASPALQPHVRVPRHHPQGPHPSQPATRKPGDTAGYSRLDLPNGPASKLNMSRPRNSRCKSPRDRTPRFQHPWRTARPTRPPTAHGRTSRARPRARARKVHGGGALRACLGGQMQLGIGQRGSDTGNEAHIRDD